MSERHPRWYVAVLCPADPAAPAAEVLGGDAARIYGPYTADQAEAIRLAAGAEVASACRVVSFPVRGNPPFRALRAEVRALAEGRRG